MWPGSQTGSVTERGGATGGVQKYGIISSNLSRLTFLIIKFFGFNFFYSVYIERSSFGGFL